MSFGEQIKELGRKVDSLMVDVAEIKAKVETASPINQAQIDALFEARDTHADRISAIERDYVRRTTHDALADRTSTLELNMSKHIGMLVAIVAVLNFVGIGGISAIVFWGGGK